MYTCLSLSLYIYIYTYIYIYICIYIYIYDTIMNIITHVTYTKDNESVESWLQIEGMDVLTIAIFQRAANTADAVRGPDLGPESFDFSRLEARSQESNIVCYTIL